MAMAPDILPNQSAPVIVMTDAAALKIHELLIEEGDAEQKLRISITGGGCSGFQYQFSFDHQQPEDVLIERTEVDTQAIHAGILVDMLSLDYLEGATIDYKNDVNGERFVIVNPKSKGTCGCGSSFDM
jgi:iron-sulfur cluster insertion protein